ncbi:MAG: hypothetical protein ACR2ML_01065 [Solirubrobacteraceae bacterium]
MATTFPKARQRLLEGALNLTSDTIKAVLVDVHDITGSTITGVTNVVNPTITTSAAHGLLTGGEVVIGGVLGATGVNGTWVVASAPTTTTFTITAAAPGVYTSGGWVFNLALELLGDIPAAGRVAISPALAAKTVVNGVFDADDAVLPAVTGDPIEVIVVYKDTGAVGTSTLIALIDKRSDGTDIAFTPNGGSLTVAWSGGADRIFRLTP